MDWSKFFSEGGYGFYVWGSYGLALLFLGGEVLVLLRRRKALPEHLNQPLKTEGIKR